MMAGCYRGQAVWGVGGGAVLHGRVLGGHAVWGARGGAVLRE